MEAADRQHALARRPRPRRVDRRVRRALRRDRRGAYGAEVRRLDFEPGTAADAEACRRARCKEDPRDQGRPRHPQRDLNRRHQRPRRHRQGDPRRQPGHPLHRRRHQLARLPALRDRRLGHRRRDHLLPEGLHDPAGPRFHHAESARLGRLRAVQDAEVLPRRRQVPRLREERPAAVHARCLALLRPRQGAGA